MGILLKINKMKQTTPLSKTQYPTKHHYDPQEYIRKLASIESYEIETVTDLQGTAGRAIPEPCEVSF